MTGGMAYEALNNLGHSGTRVVIVLNDNGRSYAPTVAGCPRAADPPAPAPRPTSAPRAGRAACASTCRGRRLAYSQLKALQAAIREVVEPHAFFEALGVRYAGPIDGHDIAGVEEALRAGGRVRRPGRRARASPRRAAATRRPRTTTRSACTTPAGVRPRHRPAGRLVSAQGLHPGLQRGAHRAAEQRPADRRHHRGHAGTHRPAARSRPRFPDRFLDVGIAEQHAARSAAGMAMGGLRPVVAVYSTFFSRCLRPGQPRRRPARPAGRVRPRPGRHHRRRRRPATTACSTSPSASRSRA